MFFQYCILLSRPSDEFWESRPSQILYCIQKYSELLGGKSTENKNTEVTEITSMREIAGWGDKA